MHSPLNYFSFSLLKVDLNQVDNPDEDCVYLAGNSLGLKPKKADTYQTDVMSDWGKMFELIYLYLICVLRVYRLNYAIGAITCSSRDDFQVCNPMES